MNPQDKDESLRIAEIVISELEHFDNNFKIELTPGDEQRYLVLGSQLKLKAEPFVAYIRAEVNGEEKVYLVCRNYTPIGISPEISNGIFLSYKAPLGRLASIPLGTPTEITTPSGLKEVVILEKDVFIPRYEGLWDATDNRLFLENDEVFIKSLRELIDQRTEAGSTFLDSDLLTLEEMDHFEELEESLVHLLDENFKMLRNKIADEIALRDQPILDAFQDELFRLPLSSQLIITGAPGTGKTTVLIKRLSQKTKVAHLSDEEKAGLNKEQVKKMFDPKTSWLMFTPNELLKNYLKEALSTELLAANDFTVQLWANTRILLARDILRFLKAGKSGMYTKTSLNLLSITKGSELIQLVNQFTDYYYEASWQIVGGTITRMHKQKASFEKIESKDRGLQKRVSSFIDHCNTVYQRTLNNYGADPEERNFILFERLANLRPEFDDLKKEMSNIVNRALRRIIAKNPRLIEEILSVTISYNSSSKEPIPETQKKLAVRYIRDAVIGYVESRTNKTSSRSKTQIRVWEKIDTQLTDDEKIEIAESLEFIIKVRAALRMVNRLLGGYANIINNIPKYYDDFRKDLLKEVEDKFLSKEYSEQIKGRKLSENEIDIIIFVMLRDAKRVFQRNVDLLYGYSSNQLLEAIKTQYKTQIAVDEATDFSPVQLGCMYHLTHPYYNSISLVGDLMQRVTTQGLADWEECRFISERFQVKELYRAYRQSPKLLTIAKKLYVHAIGQEAPFTSAFTDDGQDPEALKFHSTNNELLGEWIVQRILEIYELTDFHLPSIAVFVAEDKDIEEVYSIICDPLNDNSIEVEKCPEGRILGTGSKVRIFSVEYIKGLEFGAVFFINIDRIYERTPDLVDKYLYVGLTRATTFLGVTYTSKFPERLSIVEEDFKDSSWTDNLTHETLKRILI